MGEFEFFQGKDGTLRALAKVIAQNTILRQVMLQKAKEAGYSAEIKNTMYALFEFAEKLEGAIPELVEQCYQDGSRISTIACDFIGAIMAISGGIITGNIPQILAKYVDSIQRHKQSLSQTINNPTNPVVDPPLDQKINDLEMNSLCKAGGVIIDPTLLEKK